MPRVRQPNRPRPVMIGIYVSEELYEALRERAASRKTSMTKVAEAALKHDLYDQPDDATLARSA